MKVALIVLLLPYAWCYLYTGMTLAMNYYYCRRYSPSSLAGALAYLRVFIVESNHFALLLAVRLLPFPRPRVRTEEGPGAPIVFCHGYTMDGSCFFMLKRRLRRAGYGNFHSVSLKRLFAPIDELAARFADDLRAVLAADPGARLRIVAHSMGGLVARAALRDRSLASRVDLLITLGSPHHGTPVARYAPGRNARDMEPGSSFLATLGNLPVPVVSIYSRTDNLIFPHSNSIVGGAENIEVSLAGHMGMIVSADVGREVSDALARSARVPEPSLV
ncbi:MAG: alpha/beta fold hydrolase [Acidobacteria bacterium]|nr:alpha/beta fold hydrolase [Acidobacteriota bacterium]